MQSIDIHVGLSIAISVLTTCTFMVRQVCIIEPSFFNATSGMHRRPIEGRQLVLKCKASHFLIMPKCMLVCDSF